MNAVSSAQSVSGGTAFSEPTSATQRRQPNAQLLAVALDARNLQQGDSGADVRILQRYLSRNGLYPYEVDGVFGIETATAVATYQRIRDLPATGIADEATLIDMDFDFLPTAAAPAFTPSATTNSPGASLLSGSLLP
ncbi:MAG: peptidoglycan-binding domain-containing protein, partial [Cyanobacteria bacterium J06598_3]